MAGRSHRLQAIRSLTSKCLRRGRTQYPSSGPTALCLPFIHQLPCGPPCLIFDFLSQSYQPTATQPLSWVRVEAVPGDQLRN